MTLLARRSWVPWLALAAILLATVGPNAVTAAQVSEFGPQIPGRNVYDPDQLLTRRERQDMETLANTAEESGVSVVIYIREKPASAIETYLDAARLLETWEVESSPDAGNGLVFVANVRLVVPRVSSGPNRRFGEVAYAAGPGPFSVGGVTTSDVAAIFEDVMVPDTEFGLMAPGLAEGLRVLAYDAQFAPEQRIARSGAQEAIGWIVRWPLALIGLAATLGLLGLWTRLPRHRAPARHPVRPTNEATPDPIPPSFSHSPGVLRALQVGRIDDDVAAATLFDLAARGALAIEPMGRRQARLRLIDPALIDSPHEAALWQALTAVADRRGVIGPKDLRRLRGTWHPFKPTLRSELEWRGWYDPETYQRRRRLAHATIAALALAAVTTVLAIVGREAIGLLMALAIAIGATVTLLLARNEPATTPEGYRVATAGQATGSPLRPSPDETGGDVHRWLLLQLRGGRPG